MRTCILIHSQVYRYVNNTHILKHLNDWIEMEMYAYMYARICIWINSYEYFCIYIYIYTLREEFMNRQYLILIDILTYSMYVYIGRSGRWPRCCAAWRCTSWAPTGSVHTYLNIYICICVYIDKYIFGIIDMNKFIFKYLYIWK
jgi:hypothetical protein